MIIIIIIYDNNNMIMHLYLETLLKYIKEIKYNHVGSATLG